jgi:FAD/FMN-containing dehydrogenase
MSPACIFRPASADEVSQAVKILVSGQCRFAVKSGGHMPIPGANSIDGGVSIDLGGLNQTVLSTDRSSVSLGAGSTWGNAYDNFAADNIGFPGGVCGTTGVGGVSIGGGESLFQPRVGWVVDNVLNYEVVLASGEIAAANETSNPGLYRALKGGGGNFGIVTRVDVAAFEQGDLWAGQIVVPATDATIEQALQATTTFTELNNVHVNAGLQTAFISFANGTKIIDLGFASTDGTVNPEILQPFMAMQPQILNTVRTRSLSDLIHEFDVVLPGGYR